MNDFAEIVKAKDDEDLLIMVYKIEEWSPEMLKAIEAELAKRGILPNDINFHKQQLTELEDAALSIGKKASMAGQVVGWLMSFGLLGIFIGYHYSFSKTRNKYSGKQYFKYDEYSRKNGSYLFYTSMVLSTLGILYKLLSKYRI